MIEIIPTRVDTALLYFHTRRSCGDEIAPFVDEIRQGLPDAYIPGDRHVVCGPDLDPVGAVDPSGADGRQRELPENVGI